MKLTAKTIRQFLIATGLMAIALFVASSTAFAQSATATECPPFLNALNACQPGIKGVVLLIVNFFLGFLGLLALVMVIYGGFLYVSSAGNEENVGKAKKILIYAAIGIVVILVAYPVVNTLLGATSQQ